METRMTQSKQKNLYESAKIRVICNAIFTSSMGCQSKAICLLTLT